MQKRAETHFPIHDLLAERWSPVTYSERPVEPERLGSLIEAARWAASCYNEQPWRFIVATKDDPAAYDRMLGCLVELNVAWAQHAPVLMIAAARERFETNETPNGWAQHDVGMAVMSLLLQAAAMGLHAHGMAGFKKDVAREALGIPEGYEPMTAIAVGYLGDIENASEKLKQRDQTPRQRRPIESIVFSGQWGVPADFIET
jgi:nitroreductase